MWDPPPTVHLTVHDNPKKQITRRGKWYRDTVHTVRKVGPLTKAEMAHQQQRLDETFQQVSCSACCLSLSVCVCACR